MHVRDRRHDADPPETLSVLFAAAIDAGATRLALCDTAGAAIPAGVARLVRFAREALDARGARDVRLDFHAHNDRGLAVANSLAALEHGAERVHGCALW